MGSRGRKSGDSNGSVDTRTGGTCQSLLMVPFPSLSASFPGGLPETVTKVAHEAPADVQEAPGEREGPSQVQVEGLPLSPAWLGGVSTHEPVTEAREVELSG